MITGNHDLMAVRKLPEPLVEVLDCGQILAEHRETELWRSLRFRESYPMYKQASQVPPPLIIIRTERVCAIGQMLALKPY